jgi:xylan 1,4-beta-xylosidase
MRTTRDPNSRPGSWPPIGAWTAHGLAVLSLLVACGTTPTAPPSSNPLVGADVADAASSGAAGGGDSSTSGGGSSGGGAESSSGTSNAGDGSAAASPEAGISCPPVDSTTGPARAVTVDAQKVVGTIRSLQGAHWDPGPAKQALSLNYVAMGVDMIRTHDAGGIGGSGAGDIDGVGSSRMFPNVNADPTLAASYNFGPSDTMINDIVAAGAEVHFRVGRSNLTGTGQNTPPPDFAKYAQIVQHVIMHYNQGWDNGFSLGIRYFEIWNEPDFTPFWTGTAAQYYDLYKTIALSIKAADSKALVGGPAISTFNDIKGLRVSFLKYLKTNQVPLDFYSFHKYTNKSQDPMDFAREAQSYRSDLDANGFTGTQIVNSEWESSLEGDVMLGGLAGNAAFVAESLMYMQDAPVDRSTTYMTIGSTATKETLAFEAISKLNATPLRLCAQGGDNNGFAVLAGLGKSTPELQVVIANYQISTSLMGPIPGGNQEAINIPGMGTAATMTYLDRRTFTYPENAGTYALTIQSIPDSWGDVSVKQYRIDANNNLALVTTTVVKAADRPQGSLTVSGAWVHAPASPPNDPKGAAQGLDLIVVTGTAAN